VRSSFRRCAAELRLPEERAEKQESVLRDGVVQAVLRWLRDRTEADDEWLVIVDNADDVSWGIREIMPKGPRGSVIVTSRYDKSVRLAPWAYELVDIGVMSPVEGVALLLQHLQLDAELASEAIRHDCGKIAQRLGYLALAIDLAGAYIGNGSAPEHDLSQYLADYDRHRDELLTMDGFQGLLPAEKTVYTVWDTSFGMIRRQHPSLEPELLLIFLAQFKGSIVQDELFRLACLGMAAADAELDGEADDVMPANLRQFLPLNRGEWDSFRYRQSCDVLVRYSLLQRVEGQWPGVAMHSLVQWRAMRNMPDRRWRSWYMAFILAACLQMREEKAQPEFRRHLMVHLPDMGENDAEDADWRRYEAVMGAALGRIYYDEGRWEEAAKLQVQVMETSKTKLGADHPDTLKSMNNLASTYMEQGRWLEAEKLNIQVMETSKTKLGPDHPGTLTSMHNLASIYTEQGRWLEAEKLNIQVMEIRKTKLGPDHPNTLTSMNNLASTYMEQGRWLEAEKLNIEVMETRKTKLGPDHPNTLTSMNNLASTFMEQGRWLEAEKLNIEVMETRKTKLGPDHPDTLTSMNNLAFTWNGQGRRADALALMEDCVQALRRVLGEEHPYTLSSLAAVATFRG
jgi:tetratricopeptide (TPR) repeat protein